MSSSVKSHLLTDCAEISPFCSLGCTEEFSQYTVSESGRLQVDRLYPTEALSPKSLCFVHSGDGTGLDGQEIVTDSPRNHTV